MKCTSIPMIIMAGLGAAACMALFGPVGVIILGVALYMMNK